MSATETTVEPSKGFCFRCGTSVDGDLSEHFAQEHQQTASKPKAPIKSWKSRLDNIVTAIEEIRQESDVAVQVRRLDQEVIQELYLVRARMTQTTRNNAQRSTKKKEG